MVSDLRQYSTERLSIFDMLKIGVGPSSSHTLGPWRAARRFCYELRQSGVLDKVARLRVELFGSLAKTGIGHGTDIAILLGLQDFDPETIDTATIPDQIRAIADRRSLQFGGKHPVPFQPERDLLFHFDRSLEFHANGLRFTAWLDDETQRTETYFSVGGGFVVAEADPPSPAAQTLLPYPCDCSADLLEHCLTHQIAIADMVWKNELCWRSPVEIESELLRIWQVMLDAVYVGCHTPGILPGGLFVRRRAAATHARLMQKLGNPAYQNQREWLQLLRSDQVPFRDSLQWISCFALAVNEVNASFGRVVTAPTNGAAGVIPAVLLHLYCSEPTRTEADVIRFLSTAAEIGTFFKKSATISAAMGGCQAEIGVSSAMAAAALTEAWGGSVAQSLMAAEIAMEHHLGLTCDPVGGLVQIPCIERNTMGAVKAINAANLALDGDPAAARVSLDKVIETMWRTAQDMHHHYKETSEGGLAATISVSEVAC